MHTTASRFLKNILTLAVLYLTVFLVIMPRNCLEAAKSGIELCLNTIIPSLFPFFVCSGILSASSLPVMCSKFLSAFMRPLFRLPGASAMTFLLGTVSGYPVGAASAVELYSSGQCTKAEAERMTAFCNNSSPLFVIGVVGTGFLGTPTVGYLLYSSHIISALLVGILFRFYGSHSGIHGRYLPLGEKKGNKKTAILSFGGIIDSSVSNTLKVCGFIIFFSVFEEAIPEGFMKPYICSLTEISGGLRTLVQTASKDALLLPLVSLFLGISGISVLLQISSVIIPAGLSAKPMLAGKSIQGILSFFITIILTKILPISQPVFKETQNGYYPELTFSDSVLTAILSVFFVIMILTLKIIRL